MIRGTLGFGVCDPPGAALYFDQVTGAWDTNSILAGPGGGFGAFKWFGTGIFTRIFDRQTFWCVGLNFQPRNNLGANPAWAQNCFLRLENALGTIMSLEIQTSGKLAVTYGGNGTTGTGATQGLTTQTFPVGTWSGYLELRASGFGGSVTWQLWLNDVQILNGTTSTLPTQIPDRVTIANQNGTTGGVNLVPYFGVCFANVVILDAQGPAPWNDRIGPVRITSVSPKADASGNWNSTVNGAAAVPPVYSSITDIPGVDRNGAPDGDYSYVSPVALNTTQFFVFTAPDCYGRILGVNVNQCFRGASGSTTCDAMLYDGSTVNIGTTVNNGGYHTAQQFIGLSPASGTWFTAGEVGGSLWGARTTSPGLRLTQMFLEIITSLRATPFDCGASSYSF